VPSTGDAMVFRDGGDDGDGVIQRIIAGIPRHLGSDGTAVIVSLGRDAVGAAYEQRVRGWLGNPGHDCDVILGVEKILTIEEVVGSIRKLHLKDNAQEADGMASRLRAIGTDKFIYGALFIRRTGQPVMEQPLRMRMTSRAVAQDFERAFAWRIRRRSPAFGDWLKSAKPRLAPHLEINVRHVVKNGALISGSAMLESESGFSTALRPDAWTIPLISSFEGRLTVEQVYNQAKKAKRTPSDFPLPAFVEFVALLVEQGFLEVDVRSPLPV
jgi:hypothetical protein